MQLFQAVLWIFIYVATNIYMTLMGPVDMKKKYKAEWALVTGAGTGQLCRLRNVTLHTFLHEATMQ